MFLAIDVLLMVIAVPGKVSIASVAPLLSDQTISISDKTKNKKTCCRPDCQNQVAPGEYFVAGIAGRKLRYAVDGSIKVLYLVKWDGCVVLPSISHFY